MARASRRQRARPLARATGMPVPEGPAHTPRPLLAPVGRRPPPRGEAGLSLLLVMLVLFVLLIVVYQVEQMSLVELDKATYRADATRFRWLADAAVRHAATSLIMDLEQAAEQQQQGGGGGGPGASGGLGNVGGAAEADGPGQGLEESASDVTSSTDSLLDEWKSPSALLPPMGEGLELYVEVVDEDSKVNLLGLWTDDETRRQEWREVFVRLLDRAYEGTSLDFSSNDAQDILDRLDEWVRGRRSSVDTIPLPKLKKSDAQEEAERDLDTDVIETDEEHFPLTLAELGMVEGIAREHMTGFVEDGEFHPGLEEYLTLWSHLELKAEPEEDDPFASSPFSRPDPNRSSGQGEGGGEGGSGRQGGTDSSDSSGAADGGRISGATNDGRINVNLAPLAVLRAVAPDDIPTAFLEKLVEFREKVLEVRTELDERKRRSDLLGPGNSVFDDRDQRRDDELDEEDEDPTRFVFRNEGEVFSKVEEEMELSVFTDDEDKAAFTARLGVTSHVFTIKVLVHDRERGRRTSYRTVVWRVETEDGPRTITLLPLEEFHDARRLEDFPEDLSDLAESRFDALYR